ncbi:MAG TPA: hypothetical protein VMI54_05285 [Polyangiaceae bacterium]|nr:hypothetical protein [Polyangiaceae bacterium]
MACEIVSTEGGLFVLWGKPAKADFDRIIERVEHLAAMRGRPVVFITRVPVSAPPPEGETRAHLNSIMPRFIKVCASYHVVLEGTGFVSAVKRAILAGLLQLGWRSGTFFVHESAKSIVAKVERSLRPDVEAILSLADAKGLLTAPPPEDGPRPARGSSRPGDRRAGQPLSH